MTFKPAQYLRTGLTVILVLVVFISIPFIPMFTDAVKYYGLKADGLAPEFTLHDANGTPISLDDFRGRYVYLMFGYMNCPDICQNQALTFQEINHHADNKHDLHFLYITMDPVRDHASLLAAYFDGRAPNFTSLRAADVGQVQALANQYKAFFAPEYTSEGDYQIRHSGLFFLIGPDGRLRHIYSPLQTKIPMILSDLSMLRNDYALN